MKRLSSQRIRVGGVLTDLAANLQFAENIGLPVGEGLFGFTPFAEVWVGRLAMMGFITSIVEETITGKVSCISGCWLCSVLLRLAIIALVLFTC